MAHVRNAHEREVQALDDQERLAALRRDVPALERQGTWRLFARHANVIPGD